MWVWNARKGQSVSGSARQTGANMGVSTIDATIVEAEPGRRAARVRFFKKIVFRLDDGTTRTVAKAVVHSSLAGHLQPGAQGRFYLFTAIDHRGLHGFRDRKGGAFFHFPKNNEVLTLFMTIIMGLWVGGALVAVGGLPVLATIFLILGIPAYILFRQTRIQAQRQFEADNQAVVAAQPAAMPLSGS